MRSDIVPGATFPDYERPDHDNIPRRLSELQGDDPMILTLARGHYCPKEHQQHLDLAQHYPKIAVAYTSIATISSRPSFADLWRDLRELSSQIRPDWDLATPGLREAWDAGNHAPFHGWNRRAGDVPTPR